MRLKNITAMVAAIATAASLGTVAVASADAQTVTTGDATITLNAQTAGQLTGHTFKAVKIASYDVYGTEPNQSVTLRTEDDVKAEVVKYLTATSHYAEADGDPLAWAQQQDAPKLDQSVASPWLGDGTTRGLADALAPQAKSAFTPAINGTTATFTLTSPGLWLIVDQAATDASSRSLPILAGTPLTINGKQVSIGRIAMKNQTASVSKTVADQTVAAGQDASYTITTAIPNYVGYKVQGYQFTVSDTFDANAPLSYKPGTLTVKVGGQVLTADKDYTVTGFGATSKTFTIDLSKYITANGFFGTSAPKPESTFTDADLVGKTVTVEYKATVTGSTGNAGAANKPAIKYPNDPTNNENKQEVPGTPVKVFNFDYTLLKKDKTTNTTLEGAKFAISRTRRTASTSPTPPIRTARAPGANWPRSRNPPPPAPPPACSPPARTARSGSPPLTKASTPSRRSPPRPATPTWACPSASKSRPTSREPAPPRPQARPMRSTPIAPPAATGGGWSRTATAPKRPSRT